MSTSTKIDRVIKGFYCIWLYIYTIVKGPVTTVVIRLWHHQMSEILYNYFSYDATLQIQWLLFFKGRCRHFHNLHQGQVLLRFHSLVLLRFFMDLWIGLNKLPNDPATRQQLCNSLFLAGVDFFTVSLHDINGGQFNLLCVFDLLVLYKDSSIKLLVLERCSGTFKSVIYEIPIKLMSTSCNIALSLIPQNTFDTKSTLVLVMAWCRQVTSHYLSQCWPRSVSLYGITKPQWINATADFAGKSALTQVMTWHWTDTKPLPEPMMTISLMRNMLRMNYRMFWALKIHSTKNQQIFIWF